MHAQDRDLALRRWGGDGGEDGEEGGGTYERDGDPTCPVVERERTAYAAVAAYVAACVAVAVCDVRA